MARNYLERSGSLSRQINGIAAVDLLGIPIFPWEMNPRDVPGKQDFPVDDIKVASTFHPRPYLPSVTEDTVFYIGPHGNAAKRMITENGMQVKESEFRLQFEPLGQYELYQPYAQLTHKPFSAYNLLLTGRNREPLVVAGYGANKKLTYIQSALHLVRPSSPDKSASSQERTTKPPFYLNVKNGDCVVNNEKQKFRGDKIVSRGGIEILRQQISYHGDTFIQLVSRQEAASEPRPDFYATVPLQLPHDTGDLLKTLSKSSLNDLRHAIPVAFGKPMTNTYFDNITGVI